METTDQLDDDTSSSVELTSGSSTVSSFFGSDDVFAISGSSGEIPAPDLLPLPPPARVKCVGRSNKGVTWGITSVIGRRREMEDAVAVVPGFVTSTCGHVGGCAAAGSRTSGEISPVHLFGVYDGHGGSQVAKFCAERMHEVVAEEWKSERFCDSEWRHRWESTFSSSFERADDEAMTKADAQDMVGSTAVVVVLSSCQIITSNCGDSRAVLCRGAETIPLTIDQKPDRADELVRIESEGGKVINWNGARVFGVLAMSRAIGIYPISSVCKSHVTWVYVFSFVFIVLILPLESNFFR